MPARPLPRPATEHGSSPRETESLSKFIDKVKSASSLWVKTKSPALEEFFWQRGYGAVSFAKAGLVQVVDYIAGQTEHHGSISFQGEFRALLKEHGIEFDERYVWD